MDERARRAGENEALFREVNERTNKLTDEWAAAPDVEVPALQILCECSRVDCAISLPVTKRLYEETRAHGSRFLVAPGHEVVEFERVVAEREGVLLVEKTGESKPYVERLDPRSR